MTEKSRFYPDEFDWWELPEDCTKCRQPMHIRSGQDFPFCPNCAIDTRNARNGREALNALQARVALEKARAEHLKRLKDEDTDEKPYWPEGMPL